MASTTAARGLDAVDGEQLLLAIGARRLAEAIRACPAARPHARVLPSPQALRQGASAILTDPEGARLAQEALAETEAQLALSGVPGAANGGSRKRGRLADDAGA